MAQLPGKPPTLLVIDDDPGIIDVLTAYGEPWGWSVRAAGSLADGLRQLSAVAAQVIILDWQLPDSDGLASLRALRQLTAVPVLMLTVRDQEADIIRALGQGADDYVVKPFSPGQVLARCGALARRDRAGTAGETEPIRSGDLTIAAATRQLWRGEQEVELTALEWQLLLLLVSHPGRVWTRGELLDRIWGDVGDVYDRAVDMEIARLRKKLEEIAEAPRYIETVRGVGYRWRANPRTPDGR
ncbi:MAG: response regulator transcription factor [Thermaerobacter sp.]|nr:response regulator transcription factor [Thermaerobacter sp.]